MLVERKPSGVLILEPQALLRDALVSLLSAAGFVTRAEADLSPASIDSVMRAYQPDVVLLAVDPAVDASIELLHQLPLIAASWRTVVLTVAEHEMMHAHAIELGAMGVVTRDQSGDVLIKAINKVYAGELWLDRTHTAAVVSRLARGRTAEDNPDRTKVETLTRREREIVNLVAEGLTNRQLADRLFISEATVRNHLTSILAKLELSDRFQLAVFAFRRGLVPCPQTSAMLRMSAEWKKRNS